MTSSATDAPLIRARALPLPVDGRGDERRERRDNSRASGAQTLAKGLMLLELVAQMQGSRGVGLLELARTLAWNKSTTHRLLATLLAHGYVKQDEESGRYRLGLKAFQVGAAFTRDLELRQEAAPVLTALKSRTEQGISLVVLEPATREVVFIDRVEGTHPLRMHTYVGMRFPANCTASGKAIMAYLPEADLAPLLAGGLLGQTAASLTAAPAIRAELPMIRARGYATDDEENAEGIRCVAAPIFDHTGRAMAAISISGPAVQIPTTLFPELGPIVRDAADGVSRRLGFRGERDPGGR
jgi:IclR family acetate operon transcriptional repressor